MARSRRPSIDQEDRKDPKRSDRMNSNMIRTFTAPAAPSSYAQSRLHTSNSSSNIPHFNHNGQHDSHYSTVSQPTRSSYSTQNTSHSTLFSNAPAPVPTPPNATPNGVPVGAIDNVLNSRADKEASLFQICVTLRAQLLDVPGFEEQVLDVEEQYHEDHDPVMLLWHTFRRGYPLMMIYNALNPQQPLSIDESTVAESKNAESKKAQKAAFAFLNACWTKLEIPKDEGFMLSDLKASNEREINMSGFVKVVKMVQRIVNLLVQRGILASVNGRDNLGRGPPSAKRTQRQHIVDEMVNTERTYVQHLELLQSFSKYLRQNGAINGDSIHEIFLNLDELLEFQRKFLVRVEQMNSRKEDDQNWGRLFYDHAQSRTHDTKNFHVYEPFIENQKQCEEAAMRDFDKLRGAGGSTEMRQMVEAPTHFTSFLLKPFQRLSKYPLLLRELRDKGGLSEGHRCDLTLGIEAITAVLNRTNESLARQERLEAVKALKSQVEDWKHHRVEAFGDLLLYGTHTVLKGDPQKDSEREYRMYLFEKILLCCKEVNPNKPKNKLKGTAPLDKRGRPRLQLKGRIFMQNVTETGTNNKPGNYTCQIHWKGDDNIEHFVIRFTTEETMKKWADAIESQRQVCLEQQQRPAFPNTSVTEFTYMQNLQLENPHREDDDQDDDNSYAGSTLMSSRNASNTSLRSRSTTNESVQTMQTSSSRTVRPAHSGVPNLSLRTQQPHTHVVSPGDRGGVSYFSPTGESPASISSRTSTSSSQMPFTRYPQGHTDQHRYTAPAPERSSLSREGSQGQYHDRNYASSPYPINNPSHAYRLRSASSSDTQPNRRTNPAPPVPPMPANVAGGPVPAVNRSHTNSPISPYPRRATPGGDGYHCGSYSQQQSDCERASNTPREPGLVSPPLGSASSLNGDMSQPSQLKVKIKVPSEGHNTTLIVPYNITYQALRDRIDAKLQRNTNVSLSAGYKLKYLYDDEYVSIQTDEDVQTAFETWREQQQENLVGQMGEIELYIH